VFSYETAIRGENTVPVFIVMDIRRDGLPTVASTKQAEQQAEETGKAFVAKEVGYANVRTGPGKEDSVAYRIYEQDPVSCTGMKGKWTQLSDGNWISSELVSCFDFGGNGSPGPLWKP
jgi:hypothetical protein